MSIYQGSPRVDALVLYKSRPARVRTLDEKIEIELEGGQTKRVRPKDILALHPGPLPRLDDLQALTPQAGDAQEAWELLEGETTTLSELAGLIYGDFTPVTAWASWQWVMEGLLFEGEPQAITPRSPEAIAREREQRAAKARAEQEWAEFVARVERRALIPEDGERLREVERLAYQHSEQSRLLKFFGVPEQPDKAHEFLLRLKFWPEQHNPWPQRCGANLSIPELPLPALAEENRLDLTELAAFAIDDAGNQDPDDAISLDGERLWVHVADVAALVAPDSELDQQARARGATLYLPETTITMLPEAATGVLGIGLQEVSPALSFGFTCTDQGELTDIRIHSSWVRVARLSYAEAETRLHQDPFAGLMRLTGRFRQRRQANQAARLELPEVNVRVRDGQVSIEPIARLEARELVAEAMLMAGEAAARFCQQHGIAIPYAQQPAPERLEQPTSLSGMYAYRRLFKPSRVSVEPGTHFGLGLPLYTRVTSPLRRYADLLVHQQLRAFLAGQSPRAATEISPVIAQADTASVVVRKTERYSNQHWKLVYLRAHPGWQGRGVVVAQEERRAVVLIPELALETRLRARQELPLDSALELTLTEVDLPGLDSRFRL